MKGLGPIWYMKSDSSLNGEFSSLMCLYYHCYLVYDSFLLFTKFFFGLCMTFLLMNYSYITVPSTLPLYCIIIMQGHKDMIMI